MYSLEWRTMMALASPRLARSNLLLLRLDSRLSLSTTYSLVKVFHRSASRGRPSSGTCLWYLGRRSPRQSSFDRRSPRLRFHLTDPGDLAISSPSSSSSSSSRKFSHRPGVPSDIHGTHIARD